MALHDTAKQLEGLLECVSKDLEKAMKGNSAAAQRVRTGTIRLEKVAKLFRKESVKAGKSLKKTAKKAAKKAKKGARKTSRKKAAPKRAAAKKATRKAPRRKATRRKAARRR